MTGYPILEKEGHKYIDIGPASETPLVLLHGLFGTASNFDGIIDHFQDKRRIVMPLLPIFTMSLRKVSLGGLLEYFKGFVKLMAIDRMDLLGNSLGGHLALIYALEDETRLRSLTLTGSSGLYESAFGTSFPKREDYEYIKKKVKLTFYDPDIATKEMVDEVFGVVNDRLQAIRIIKTAKSAIRHNVEDRLGEIMIPTLLVWGKQDTITPPFVGEKFHALIKHSRLEMLDKCGHAPMLERPEAFNRILEDFLSQLT
jgi:pimeloyl-ACP methyl ester carboxylesterase